MKRNGIRRIKKKEERKKEGYIRNQYRDFFFLLIIIRDERIFWKLIGVFDIRDIVMIFSYAEYTAYLCVK